uniref:Uncharacterized protein n=1 Tax=Noctiluca scintillans TaxID=2966 RepID=A0A7S1B204_NOCSC
MAASPELLLRSKNSLYEFQQTMEGFEANGPTKKSLRAEVDMLQAQLEHAQSDVSALWSHSEQHGLFMETIRKEVKDLRVDHSAQLKHCLAEVSFLTAREGQQQLLAASSMEDLEKSLRTDLGILSSSHNALAADVPVLVSKAMQSQQNISDLVQVAVQPYWAELESVRLELGRLKLRQDSIPLVDSGVTLGLGRSDSSRSRTPLDDQVALLDSRLLTLVAQVESNRIAVAAVQTSFRELQGQEVQVDRLRSTELPREIGELHREVEELRTSMEMERAQNMAQVRSLTCFRCWMLFRVSFRGVLRRWRSK